MSKRKSVLSAAVAIGAICILSTASARPADADPALVAARQKISGAGSKVPCVGATSRGSLPGAELVKIDQLEPVATITGFKHLHSTNTAPQDKSFPPVVINAPVNGKCDTPCNIADPRDQYLF